MNIKRAKELKKISFPYFDFKILENSDNLICFYTAPSFKNIDKITVLAVKYTKDGEKEHKIASKDIDKFKIYNKKFMKQLKEDLINEK